MSDVKIENLESDIYLIARQLYESSEQIKELDNQIKKTGMTLTDEESELVVSAFNNYDNTCKILKEKLELYFDEENKKGNEVSLIFKKLYKKLRA